MSETFETWALAMEKTLGAAGIRAELLRDAGRLTLSAETDERIAQAVGHANGFCDLQVIDVSSEAYLLNTSVSDAAAFEEAAATFATHLRLNG